MQRGFLVVLMLAAYASGVRADEKSATAAIEKAGGRVLRDGKTGDWHVMLSGKNATDAIMKEL
jgi:hypothetical protein